MRLEVARRRMQIMTASQDGSHGPEDLQIRTECTGTKQSGLLDFRAIDLASDTNIIHSAAEWVKAILNKDNMLEHDAILCFETACMNLSRIVVV